jgi:DNA mismatch repair protein MSH4
LLLLSISTNISISGLEFVLQLCVEDDERAGTILAVSNKYAYIHLLHFLSRLTTAALRYYALSAICALFKHAESRLNARFAAGSLRIRYVPVEGTMMIDPDTARNLELVGNMVHKKSTYSLFGYGRYSLPLLFHPLIDL